MKSTKPAASGRSGHRPVAHRVTAGRAAEVGGPTPTMEALTQALARLTQLEDAVEDLTYACRWPDGRQLDGQLLALISDLRSLGSTASRAADFVADAADVEANAETREAILQLVADRELEDWTSVADTIEAVVAPVLAEWRTVLTAVAAARESPAAPARGNEAFRAA